MFSPRYNYLKITKFPPCRWRPYILHNGNYTRDSNFFIKMFLQYSIILRLFMLSFGTIGLPYQLCLNTKFHDDSFKFNGVNR